MVIRDIYDRHPLMLAPMDQLMQDVPEPVVWVVGKTWVRCEHGEYYIGADEKVARDRVYELLLEAQDEAYLWSEH